MGIFGDLPPSRVAHLEMSRWLLAAEHMGQFRISGGDQARFAFWAWDFCIANAIGWASR